MQTSQKKNELRNWPAAPGTGSATSLQILQKIFGKWAFLQLRPAKTEVRCSLHHLHAAPEYYSVIHCQAYL